MCRTRWLGLLDLPLLKYREREPEYFLFEPGSPFQRITEVNRAASHLLLLVFLALGSGAAEYVHNLQHSAEDAIEDAIAAKSGHPTQQHHHDESNCAVHAQLHMPLVVMGWVPVLVSLGLFVAFLSLLTRPLIHRAMPVRIDCRGPPLFA
jgi:hypothetical protein